MNHWLDEELTLTSHAERQRKLDAYRKQSMISGLQSNWNVTTRAALKLGDWLIATGKSLRQRQERIAAVSHWEETRKFAR